jgi:hypothetical protein
MKNNRDFKNIVFDSVGKEHEKFVYNDAAFFLVMIIVDNVLFKFKSFDDFQRQEIPIDENEFILKYEESILNRPILRKCTKADGVINEFMFKAAFADIFGSTFKNAGYFCVILIHAVRRQLNKKVDEHYIKVQRSQNLT